MELFCPKCGKSWDEEEIRMQTCKDCSQDELQLASDILVENRPAKKDKTINDEHDNHFSKGHLICPDCKTSWNWNEIGYQSCNNCDYENSRLASGVQIKRIIRAVMKYLLAVIAAVFIGVLIGYGNENQTLPYLIAAIVKMFILSFFIIQHYRKIKSYPKT